MTSDTKYYLDIEEIKEILSHHIDSHTDNNVYVDPSDIEFDIRAYETGVRYVSGVHFNIKKDIELI